MELQSKTLKLVLSELDLRFLIVEQDMVRFREMWQEERDKHDAILADKLKHVYLLETIEEVRSYIESNLSQLT